MIERRNKTRTTEPTRAMVLFLEAERHRAASEAIAVTTANGTLIAGVGRDKQVDVEYLGQLGASRRQARFEWDDKPVHVDLVQVGSVPLVLTSIGRPVNVAHVQGGLSRILAN